MTDVTEIQRREGVTFKIESQRGTGTNDRDKVKATVNAEDIDEAESKLDDALDVVEETLEELRTTQFKKIEQ